MRLYVSLWRPTLGEPERWTQNPGLAAALTDWRQVQGWTDPLPAVPLASTGDSWGIAPGHSEAALDRLAEAQGSWENPLPESIPAAAGITGDAARRRGGVWPSPVGCFLHVLGGFASPGPPNPQVRAFPLLPLFAPADLPAVIMFSLTGGGNLPLLKPEETAEAALARDVLREALALFDRVEAGEFLARQAALQLRTRIWNALIKRHGLDDRRHQRNRRLYLLLDGSAARVDLDQALEWAESRGLAPKKRNPGHPLTADLSSLFEGWAIWWPSRLGDSTQWDATQALQGARLDERTARRRVAKIDAIVGQ